MRQQPQIVSSDGRQIFRIPVFLPLETFLSASAACSVAAEMVSTIEAFPTELSISASRGIK